MVADICMFNHIAGTDLFLISTSWKILKIGKYDVVSLSFPENSQQALVQEMVRAKRKMKLADGVDLDNNGIDDGLEIEA